MTKHRSGDLRQGGGTGWETCQNTVFNLPIYQAYCNLDSSPKKRKASLTASEAYLMSGNLWVTLYLLHPVCE